MIKDPSARRLWFSAGIIVLSIVIAAVLLALILGDVSARADAIVQSRTTVVARDNDFTLLASLEHDSSTATAYLNAIQRLLPPEDSLVTFPDSITQAAAPFGVTAQASFAGASSEVSPGGAVPGYIPFSLSASGDPAALVSFLNYLEKKSTQFLVAIDSADLQFGSTGNLSATGRVFFQ